MTTSAPAPGEKSLSTLLSTLTTTLHAPTYVFISIPSSCSLPSHDIQLLFRESEGVTIVTTKETALREGLEYAFPCKMITLDVQSSLEAVGFMAVVAGRCKLFSFVSVLLVGRRVKFFLRKTRLLILRLGSGGQGDGC
jgi:hypothetical protein